MLIIIVVFTFLYCSYCVYIHIDMKARGIEQVLKSKATYNKYVCPKKEKQYVAVGTVRTFMNEPPSTNNH